MLSKKFWKKYFENYDLLNELIPYKNLLQEIVGEAKIKRGETVLDIGSGTGNLAVVIEQLGAKVVGIDFSEEGVRIHKKKLPSSYVVVGDITQPLPFADNFFDKVVTNNTLYTLSREKRPNIMKEIYRVLKHGGIFVTSNIKKGFRPFTIYQEHLCKNLGTVGFLGTIKKVIKLCIPTVKIFYYNYLIKKESLEGFYGFFQENEQHRLLVSSGFSVTKPTRYVYANQAVLDVGIKE